jgi:AraC-like DNA-binding protein
MQRWSSFHKTPVAMETFITFKSNDPLISRYVDYYYLDIKPNNIVTEFECFPHYNNTLSLYRSHRYTPDGEVVYQENGMPCQIFTPVREKILTVKQTGKVHRIVIVFHAMGIQQFYREPDFGVLNNSYNFFSTDELTDLFAGNDTDTLTHQLDTFLKSRYIAYENPLPEKAISEIFSNYEDFSVELLAEKLSVSRRHLNRVFKKNIGVSVKKFHEIVVFRKTMERKLFIRPEESFTSLAYQFNFSDQAHLNKTFGNFTKKSPTTFFKKGVLLGSQDTFWHRIR